MGYLISSTRASPLLILPILISFLLARTAFSDDNHLYHICSTSSRNYTKGSAYNTNLNHALTDLKTKTPQNNGFGLASSGQHTDPAYALALCRGDVSTGDCRACLVNARRYIATSCPHNRAAIVWRDYCLLKYSDKYFSGQIDTKNKVYLWNTKNATDPQRFKAKAIGLLRGLSRNAAGTNNKYMFARGKRLFDQNNKVTIYGMAQCSRDLSKGNCKKCLDAAVNELPWSKSQGGIRYTSPRGGRTLTGSCYVRYEIYPFLNN